MSAGMPVCARCAPRGPGRRTGKQGSSLQSKRKFHQEFMKPLHTRATVLQLLELVTRVFPLALLVVRGRAGDRRYQMAEEACNTPGSGSTIGSAGTVVKEGIVGSLRGLNEIEAH